MKIAVVGGSISGCAIAALLQDQYEVHVFERSSSLTSRGAGLGMSRELFQLLQDRGLFDSDMISYPVFTRSFHYKGADNPAGIQIWQQKLEMLGLHWDEIFNNLRRRVNDNVYHNGLEVTEVSFDQSRPTVTFTSQEQAEFDLIIFADGLYSLGRKLISPSSKLQYSGYIAWRGVIDFQQVTDKSLCVENMPYFFYDKGHFLAYLVYQNGIKKLNWVFYETMSLEQLKTFGEANHSNFSTIEKEHLYQLAEHALPSAMAKIVKDTPSPFIQKIYDTSVERLVIDNAVLLGDASMVLRPHVGNGASLALTDALSLSAHLRNSVDLNHALYQWQKETLAQRSAMYDLSKKMGEALVLKGPDWKTMTPEKMQVWWADIIQGQSWYTTE